MVTRSQQHGGDGPELHGILLLVAQDRVVLMACREFGRRLEENDTVGTDHGTAGPVFFAGPATIGGVIGGHPSLTDLDHGHLKMSLDFRAIYAKLLEDWLNP